MIFLKVIVFGLFAGLAVMMGWAWWEVWREMKERRREDHREN
jgi:hypothetical protein